MRACGLRRPPSQQPLADPADWEWHAVGDPRSRLGLAGTAEENMGDTAGEWE